MINRLVDDSVVKRTDLHSVEGLRIDLRSLDLLIKHSKPEGANTVSIKIEDVLYSDIFRFKIQYGKTHGNEVIPEGRPLELVSDSLPYPQNISHNI